MSVKSLVEKYKKLSPKEQAEFQETLAPACPKLEIWEGMPYEAAHQTKKMEGFKYVGSGLEPMLYGWTLQFVTGHSWPAYEFVLFGTPTLASNALAQIGKVLKKYFPAASATQLRTFVFCVLSLQLDPGRYGKQWEHCMRVLFRMFNESTWTREDDKYDILADLSNLTVRFDKESNVRLCMPAIANPDEHDNK